MKKIVTKLLVGLVLEVSCVGMSYATDLNCPNNSELQAYIEYGNQLSPGHQYVSNSGTIWIYKSENDNTLTHEYVYGLGSYGSTCVYAGRFDPLPSQPPYSFSFVLQPKRPVGE